MVYNDHQLTKTLISLPLSTVHVCRCTDFLKYYTGSRCQILCCMLIDIDKKNATFSDVQYVLEMADGAEILVSAEAAEWLLNDLKCPLWHLQSCYSHEQGQVFGQHPNTLCLLGFLLINYPLAIFFLVSGVCVTHWNLLF